MALTVVKSVSQQGLRFWMSALVTSNAASAATATLLDFSADLDADPEIGTGTATAVKITKIYATGHNSFASNGLWAIYSDATTDQFIMSLAGKGNVRIDFSSFPDGGILDPKASGYTGDLIVDLSNPSLTTDSISIVMEGMLIA